MEFEAFMWGVCTASHESGLYSDSCKGNPSSIEPYLFFREDPDG
jgi:hypothetical protein